MYSIEIEQEALDQIAALPGEALALYAELLAMLELTPWSGAPYNQERPEAAMRTHTFGPRQEGLVIYLLLDDQRRVIILRVLWVG